MKIFKENAIYTETIENNKTIITSDYRYASELLNTLPVESFISKTICGVGFTSVLLENTENIILAVPTKQLVDNKYAQYPNSRVNHTLIRCYGGITIESVENQINFLIKQKHPIKILVTYDSLYKLESIIEKYSFKLAIDESDQLLHFAKMKSKSNMYSSNLNVTEYIWKLTEKYKKITCFFTSTPIPLEYLPDWVSELHQWKFEWTNSVRIKPFVYQTEHPMFTTSKYIIGAIEKNGYFKLNNKYKIKKLIIYVNSLFSIMKMIEDNELDIEDVGIICGDNVKNNKFIKPYKRITDPTNLKKYSFITTAGTHGIDLFSKSALSIVVSSTRNDYTMLDAFTMQQAMSRNRDRSNPFFSTCLYIYNTSIFAETETDILLKIKKNHERLEDNIADINKYKTKSRQKCNLIKTLSSDKLFKQYTNQISEDKFEINENLFLSDKYFLIESKRQFDKGFNNLKPDQKLDDFSITIDKIYSPIFKDYANQYKLMIKNPDLVWSDDFKNKKYKNMIEYNYKKYGKIYTNIDTCKKWYNKRDTPETVKFSIKQQLIYNNKEYYTNKEMKNLLAEIYFRNKYNEPAKANHIFELLPDVTSIKQTKVDGKIKKLIKINLQNLHQV